MQASLAANDALRALLDTVHAGRRKMAQDMLRQHNRANQHATGGDIEAPYYTVCTRCINSLGNAFDNTNKAIQQTPPEVRRQIFEVGLIPVHCTVFIFYPLSTIMRRVIRLDVGAGGDTPSIAELLSDFQENLVSFTDVFQDLDTGIWITRDVDWRGDNVVSIDYDATKLRIMDHGSVSHDVHYIHQFLVYMKQYSSPYRLLTHNCQHMSMELVRFITRNEFPVWFMPFHAAGLLRADVLRAYEPVNQPIATPSDVIYKDDSHFVNPGSVTLISTIETSISSDVNDYVDILDNYILESTN